MGDARDEKDAKVVAAGEPARDEVVVERVGPFAGRNKVLLGVAVGLVLVLLVAFMWSRGGGDDDDERDEARAPASKSADEDDEGGGGGAGEVALDPETLANTEIETEAVASRAAVAPLSVTGSVEPNAEGEQQVVSLVSGSLASVNVSLGDRVGRGSELATIRSPQVAELQGRFHEARTRLSLAEANVRRVRTAANRAGVVAAKAKLDLAEKTLDRQRRLLELGAGARKDVEAAEAEYKTAKAEYDYQSNVAISREVQEAEAEAESIRATLESLRQQLVTLGAKPDGRSAIVSVPAPVSGSVTKREVNAGAAVAEGTPLFTIADTSTVWVIAHVPQSFARIVRPGVEADVRSPALGEERRRGRVSYVDPQVDEETRTTRVRVEVSNPDGQLKAGMSVDVTFQVFPRSAEGEDGPEELWIPSAAVQRIGARTVVFVPDDEPGHFHVRDIELGDESDGYVRVVAGLDEGDRVVTKGAFTIKSVLLKESFGEDDDE